MALGVVLMVAALDPGGEPGRGCAAPRKSCLPNRYTEHGPPRRHDVRRRQRRKFRFVAREQEPLAFLLAEAVRRMTVAALATFDISAATSTSPRPAAEPAHVLGHRW